MSTISDVISNAPRMIRLAERWLMTYNCIIWFYGCQSVFKNSPQVWLLATRDAGEVLNKRNIDKRYSVVQLLEIPKQGLNIATPILAEEEPIPSDGVLNEAHKITHKRRRDVLDGVEAQTTQLHLRREPLHPVEKVSPDVGVAVVDICAHAASRRV